MVNYYLVRDSSVTDQFNFDFVSVPRDLVRFLNSWIHEEVPHDFLSVDADLNLDVDVCIDLDKFKKALLRTFAKDYNMDYLKEHDV